MPGTTRRALVLSLALVLGAACGSVGSAGPAAPIVPPPPAADRASQGWWDGAVFYEVFVRSFRDSDADGKGDLAGLTAKLDHLNDGDPVTTTDLGVDAIWLMPVFASPSYHGYDVTDYEAIAPDYGTTADLDRLVAEAHRRGVKVILDLVLNHTSDQHPWFADSATGPAAAHRDWYVWRDANPGWTQPWNASQPVFYLRNGSWYYALFWSGMPDLNYGSQAVRDEAKRIAALWLARGVDGFRLDAARYLVETGPGAGQASTPETHAFWKELAAAVKAAKPDALLVGEVWSTPQDIAGYWGTGGDELQLLFDFPVADAIVRGVRDGDAWPIAVALRTFAATAPAGAVDAPFLTNHDQVRVATQLGDDPARLRVAAAILLTLPGSPFVYYGEELGLRSYGTDGPDEWKRTPMPWDDGPGRGFTAGTPWFPFSPGTASVAAETGDPASLLSRYRALVRLRHASPALTRGDLFVLPTATPVLAYVRRAAGETVLAVHNLGGERATLPPVVIAGAAAPLLVDPDVTLDASAEGWRAALPGHSSGVWRFLAP